jgi:predicted transcriptional regulator
MRSEFKLLKTLANNPKTRFHENNIHELGNYNADIEDLVEEGLIRIEKMSENGRIYKYYKITLKGYELLKDLKIRDWQFWITIAVLVISLASLAFQIIR